MSMTSSFVLPVSQIAGILILAVPHLPNYVLAIYKRGVNQWNALPRPFLVPAARRYKR